MENTNHYLTTICGGQSSAAVLLRRSGKRKGYGMRITYNRVLRVRSPASVVHLWPYVWPYVRILWSGVQSGPGIFGISPCLNFLLFYGRLPIPCIGKSHKLAGDLRNEVELSHRIAAADCRLSKGPGHTKLES